MSISGDTLTNFTLDRLDGEPSDVTCPGLMNRAIHAFARDDPGRRTVFDHALRQLPSSSTHRHA